jgi:hypothetical protein
MYILLVLIVSHLIPNSDATEQAIYETLLDSTPSLAESLATSSADEIRDIAELVSSVCSRYCQDVS